jgi:peptidoglycan/LPS O-acetylase OafA/YrhL
MLVGLEMKIVVIAIGALLLLPCLLAYLFGRTVPGWIGFAMEWMGARTYSIYLWQQPFTICNFLPNIWHPVGSLMATALGAAWYRWFEFPFLSSGRQKQERSREIA